MDYTTFQYYTTPVSSTMPSWNPVQRTQPSTYYPSPRLNSQGQYATVVSPVHETAQHSRRPEQTSRSPPVADGVNSPSSRERSTRSQRSGETRIALLGTTFDINGLGKWIYDWAVHVAGSRSLAADVAGALWLSLIKLYGKVGMAKASATACTDPGVLGNLVHLIGMGSELQERWVTLLKKCERPMLRCDVLRKSNKLGQDAGIKFIETLFGRDKFLDDVMTLVTKITRFAAEFRRYYVGHTNGN